MGNLKIKTGAVAQKRLVERLAAMGLTGLLEMLPDIVKQARAHNGSLRFCLGLFVEDDGVEVRSLLCDDFLVAAREAGVHVKQLVWLEEHMKNIMRMCFILFPADRDENPIFFSYRDGEAALLN